MKVKIVEVNIYIADDGKEFDSAEELATHQFECHIQKLMKKENCPPEDAVEFIVYNWPALITARELIYKDVYRELDTAIQNHKNLQGVL